MSDTSSVRKIMKTKNEILTLVLLSLSCTYAQTGNQHVGPDALKKRNEVLESRSDAIKHPFKAGSTYDHLPVIKFHHGGEMDLCSISVVGTTRNEADPFETEIMWVEDQNDRVVYLQEFGVHGGFAVAPHLKVPGTKLTPYALDDLGIWVGETVDVPSKVPPRDEL